MLNSIAIMIVSFAVLIAHLRLTKLEVAIREQNRLILINYNEVERFNKKLDYQRRFQMAKDWVGIITFVSTFGMASIMGSSNTKMFTVTKKVVDINQDFKYNGRLVRIVDVHPDEDGYKYIFEYVDMDWN